LSAEEAKKDDRKKKKELYFSTRKPFQRKRNEQTSFRKNEKTGIVRRRTSIRKETEQIYRHSVIIKVRKKKKKENGQ
jgi:hypothetical protein